jgi:hypothetical protein
MTISPPVSYFQPREQNATRGPRRLFKIEQTGLVRTGYYRPTLDFRNGGIPCLPPKGKMGEGRLMELDIQNKPHVMLSPPNQRRIRLKASRL